jgi:hypothetical protein
MLRMLQGIAAPNSAVALPPGFHSGPIVPPRRSTVDHDTVIQGSGRARFTSVGVARLADKSGPAGTADPLVTLGPLDATEGDTEAAATPACTEVADIPANSGSAPGSIAAGTDWPTPAEPKWMITSDNVPAGR